MSLKGIENQMMVTRTSELGKEAANQIRKDANAQEFAAAQAKSLAEHEKKSVAQTEEIYKAELKNDKEGYGGGDRRQQQERKKPEGPDEAELPAGYNENTIDIKI